jgi:hypothetical protein
LAYHYRIAGHVSCLPILLFLPEEYINYTPPQLFYLIAIESVIILFLSTFAIGVSFHTLKTSSSHIIATLLVALLTLFFSCHLFFTTIFAAIGLRGPNGEVTHNKWDALYFSIITWTTTGYGDFRPIEVGRWYACVEALLGPFFYGFLLVAVIYHLNLIAKPRLND